MNRSRNPIPRRTALAASAAALLAACAGLTPPVPDAIATGPDDVHAMTVAAEGVQVYECRRAADGTASWALVAPEAELFDRHGRPVGRHGAGPHWQADDGSRLDGQVTARADAPASDAIPWLLLATRTSGPEGRFSKVTRIQRVNTAGGKAPGSACSDASVGRVERVPYRADYRMFVGRAAARPAYATY